MSHFRKFSGLFALVVVAAWAIDAAARSADDFFDQSFGDLREELATAREEGKLGLLVMFDNADCPWCAKMKATVLNQTRVQDYYRKYFRILRIDTEGDVAVTDFKGEQMPEKDFAFLHNRVRATPVFIFFDLKGEPVTKYTGATRDAEEFMLLGEFVAEGHYKHGQRFTAFKRERRDAGQK